MRQRRPLLALLATAAAVAVSFAGFAASVPAQADANTLISQGKPVTASSIEGAGFEAAKAVDGNATSRWASVEGVDPQWLRIDLGAGAKIDRVVLKWEAAYARGYRLETSNDGTDWTPLKTETAGNGGTDEHTALNGAGRYLRVYGTARGTTYGYSLFEVEVYGSVDGGGTPTPTPTPTQNPTDVLITKNRPATASSVEAAGFEAAKAVDGNATTSRWASVEGVDPQWIQVDLGAGAKVNKVVLKWEAAYASKYKVQISPDGTAWTTLKDEIAGNGGTDEHLTPGGTGRYLRVTGTARGTAYGYSLFELEAYGTPGDGSGGPSTGTPIAKAGTLKVCGLQLCDQYGKPVQLRGMSTHGINWYKQCMTDSAFDALAKDWKADVVRISTYVDGEGSGYKYDPSLLGLAESMIQKNHDRGMYSIADWHMLEDGDPNSDLELAKKFFTSIATKHGSKGTVLYEIANEPHGVPWSTIKSYAEKIIPVIRAIDPDAVILVGTPQWSSLGVSGGGGPASIISNPVNASNIMYVFHFYATSHRDEYLAALDSTSDKLPIFVTEWGAEEYTGDGQLDFVMAEKFLTLMDQKKIGWVKWNFSDNALTGAAFKPGTCANNGPWSGSSLKPSGAWAINHVRAGAL